MNPEKYVLDIFQPKIIREDLVNILPYSTIRAYLIQVKIASGLPIGQNTLNLNLFQWEQFFYEVGKLYNEACLKNKGAFINGKNYNSKNEGIEKFENLAQQYFFALGFCDEGSHINKLPKEIVGYILGIRDEI